MLILGGRLKDLSTDGTFSKVRKSKDRVSFGASTS